MKKQGDTVTGKNPRYDRYKPSMYSKRTPIFWWVSKKSYVFFILRELTSVCVAAYAVVMIFQIRALSQGPEAFEVLMSFFANPFSIVLHVIILGAVIFHSITWFKLAPTAMVLKFGKKRIPGSLIIAANFLMWIILSVAIGWLILST